MDIIAGEITGYFEGLWLTIQLVSISLFIGLLLAVPLAIIRASVKNWYANAPIRAFVYVMRGTPLLVQIYLIYYGMGQFELIRESFLWIFFKEAYFCALFAFTLNTAGYTTEIIRGAIVNTSFGEIEAAKSVGMSKLLMLRRIILPSAFRRALPAYGNEVIFMIHGSSLASAITLVDITGYAIKVNSRYYAPFEAYITAAIFYMALIFTTIWVFKKIEYRLSGHLRRQDEITLIPSA